MSRFAVHAVWAALVAALLPAVAAAQVSKFEHIIFIVQENRTPDNMFHGLQKWLPTADIADSGLDSKGKLIPLRPLPLSVPFDLGHLHQNFVAMYDKGKMDGADLQNCTAHCPENPAYHFVQYADVAPYFDMAINYGFANRMFQTNQGPSFPAHQFIYAGTSQVTPKSQYFAADEPDADSVEGAGCSAHKGQLVPLIGPDGRESRQIFPCFEHKTLTDLLDSPLHDKTHPISWRYYTYSNASIWTAPNAIKHICQVKGGKCAGPDFTDGHITPWPAQILQDIHFHQLNNVSWVTPTAQDSDHASANDGSGPSWVASIVNAVGQSEYWKNTVIFVAWDDWGGWYDHVVPPIDPKYGYYEYGFRVPLLVISPYTPKGYVSQRQHNFGSLLHFVETRYNLGLIPPGDFADARSDDLMDFFDFTKPPRAFVPIKTKIPESHFLDRNRPMLPPDDD